jgi:uncharacterized protein (TIGR02452 family)
MEALLALPGDQQMALGTCISYEYTTADPAPALPRIGSFATIFGTVEQDSFEAAAELMHQGWPKPAVLNMANEHNCGGAWCQKPGSQEEDLLRCSSLPLSLWPRRLRSDHRMPEFDDRLPRQQTIYPFTEAGVIYSPNVLVCRSRDGKPFANQHQSMVGVVSSAAQDLREEKPHYKGPFDPHLTTEKLRSHLWAAAHHGHTALVLGAFGCGAFRNDPDQMIKLYMQLLGPGGEFEGCFEIILFAIIKSGHLLRRFGGTFPRIRHVPGPAKGKGKGRGSAERAAVATAEASNATAEASSMSSDEKEVLKLAKKMREIRELEQRIAEGKIIAPNQLTKIDSKDEFFCRMTNILSSLPANSDVKSKVQDLMDF